MAHVELQEEFYIGLTAFLIHAKQQLVNLGAQHGLTVMQTVTLLLTDHEPRPMNSLGRAFDCDASNVTGIIDGLEEKGLVSRKPSPNDRRVKVIYIEPAGEAVRSQIIDHMDEGQATLFYGLTGREIKQLAALISKISSKLEN